MAIKPIGENLLIEPINEDVQKVGSIYVPDSATEKQNQGTVVAIGDSVNDEESKQKINLGDVVLFAKFAGSEVEYSNKEYILLSKSDILAIIE